MRRLLVIIPAYNEETTVRGVVEAVKARGPALAETHGVALSVAVIDDGSVDRTSEEAKAGGADVVFRLPVNQGLGGAVRTGIRLGREGGYDLLLKMDADGQHDPDDIAAVIAPILAGEVEIVYGNRFERIGYKMPFVRHWGNRVFTGLMKWLTGWPVKDSQPGIFAVARAYIEVSYLPGSYNYTQQVLLDAYHKGMRFAQVPVAFNERTAGSSFVKLSYPFKVLPQIVMVLIGVKPFKVFGPIALAFIGMAVAVFVSEIVDWMFFGAPKPVGQVNFVLGTGLFGVQTLFFGLLAELVIGMRR